MSRKWPKVRIFFQWPTQWELQRSEVANSAEPRTFKGGTTVAKKVAKKAAKKAPAKKVAKKATAKKVAKKAPAKKKMSGSCCCK